MWENKTTKSQVDQMKKADLVAAYWQLNEQAAQAVNGQVGQIQNMGQQIQEQGRSIVDLTQRLAAAAQEKGQLEAMLAEYQTAMEDQTLALEDLPVNVMACRSLGELVTFIAFRFDPQQPVPPLAKAMLNGWVGKLRPMPQEQPAPNG